MLGFIKKHIRNIGTDIRRLGKDGWDFSDVEYLLDDNKTTRANYYFDILVTVLIVISCLLYVVLTYLEPGSAAYIAVFAAETFLMTVFTVEYLLRLHLEKRPKDYMTSWYGIFDVAAVVPFWLAFLVPGIPGGLQFLRILRVFKLYRFFKKYLDKESISQSVAARILITKMVFTLGALLFISSGLIYTFEAPNNADINSFDDALYFSLVTVTTVGFGDITPVSKVGRIAVMCIVLFSIFLIPVYLASLMRTYMLHQGKRSVICTVCGLKYHDANAVHCKMCDAVIYQEYEG